MKTLLRYIKNSRNLGKILDPEERYVAKQLIKKLPPSEYAVINDVLIPHGDKGWSSQIDHIIVSVYGIFCIETKSHKGWILAIRSRQIFQQILYRAKYSIVPNPVVQNSGHVHALNELLGSKVKSPIMNIVVFPSADKLLVQGYSHVEWTYEAIEDILKQNTKIYSYQEASDIITEICAANDKSYQARQNHIALIQSKYSRV